jgi:hypothetical protein
MSSNQNGLTFVGETDPNKTDTETDETEGEPVEYQIDDGG